MRRRGQVAAALALVMLAAAALAPTAAAGATQAAGVEVSRYGGADRYATSLEVAEAVAALAGGSLERIVLVSGRNWTDAVVAAPLAGSLGAPLLATPPGALRADAEKFLLRAGVKQALVVGTDSDTSGVGPAVTARLRQLGISTERVTGEDQYAASAAAARRIGTPGGMGSRGRTAVIASGEVFADALVAGALAAEGRHPILLSPPDALHPEAARYLADAKIGHAVLMGGSAALSEAVEASITALGIKITRLDGATRFETAAAAADFVVGRAAGTPAVGCFSHRRAGLARARVPYDAFSAAPLLARLCAPLLLAEPTALPAPTSDYLDWARSTTAAGGADAVDLRVFGGSSAVSEAAIIAYQTGVRAPANPIGGDGLRTDAVALERQPQQPCLPDSGEQPIPLLGDEFAYGATWSPDCTRIAYIGLDDEERGRLFVARPDGTDRRLLTKQGGGDASWSPDGTRIAFVRSDGTRVNGDATQHIYVINADGSGRKRITSGKVADSSPTWSPDSKRIAFTRRHLDSPKTAQNREDRYIAAMDADGKNVRALTRGGTAEATPAWSPDGSRIAYDSDGTLWTMDTDGTNPTRVPVADASEGYSWSPDGTAIAYVSLDFFEDPDIKGGTGVKNGITVVTLDGSASAHAVQYVGPLVSDTRKGYFGVVRSPRWAPDGRTILFERNNHQGDMARIYAAPVPALATVKIARDCRPTGGPFGSAGFPLPSTGARATGTLNVAVLFVDFSDAAATGTTAAELRRGDLSTAQEYIEAVSYGRLKVKFTPLHRWLRAPETSKSYISDEGDLEAFEISEAAAALASSHIDFADIDAFITVAPSSHFAGARGAGYASVGADDDRRPAALANIAPEEGRGPPWGDYLIPLIFQMFDLPYLGDFGAFGAPDSQVLKPELPSGQSWYQLRVGTEGMSAHFPSPITSFYGEYWEPLAWTRWQLGWIRPSDMRCINASKATVELSPLAGSGAGIVMAAVPVAHDTIIVAESRRRTGYDSLSSGHRSAIAAGRVRPELTGDRVLVYTVDPTLRGGRRPIKFATDNGFGYLERYPLLAAGESVRIGKHTVSVIADDNRTHTIRISTSG